MERPHQSAKRAARNVDAHAREDLVLAVQRQMVVELRDQHVGKETATGHAAGNRAAGSRRLDHLLAAAAGLLRARDFDHLELGRDHLEDLAHVFADEA